MENKKQHVVEETKSLDYGITYNLNSVTYNLKNSSDIDSLKIEEFVKITNGIGYIYNHYEDIWKDINIYKDKEMNTRSTCIHLSLAPVPLFELDIINYNHDLNDFKKSLEALVTHTFLAFIEIFELTPNRARELLVEGYKNTQQIKLLIYQYTDISDEKDIVDTEGENLWKAKA